MPWLLSTGDDDGVIKVRVLCLIRKFSKSRFWIFSCGILGRKNAHESTLSISITSQIFYGWMIKSNLLQQGTTSHDVIRVYSLETTLFSGDGTLSVMDVRSKKPEPFAQSEDQEDELLSIVAIKGCVQIVHIKSFAWSLFYMSCGWKFWTELRPQLKSLSSQTMSYRRFHNDSVSPQIYLILLLTAIYY